MEKQNVYTKALVTGAGGDLGSALCRILVAQGTEVVALNRSREPLLKLVEELGDTGKIMPYFADVTQFEALEQTLRDIVAEHPDIDLLVLNAGVATPQRIEQFDWRIARAQIDTNLTANYIFLSVFMPQLLAQGRGQIALVASLGAYVGSPYGHVYNASKAGVRMLVDGVRAELDQRPVAITGIYPGFIEGRMIAGSAYHVDSAVPADEAARIIVDGLQRGESEIRFPEETVALVERVVAMPAEERDATLRGIMGEAPN
ncbi:MAG: SDR family NAD(P)-dependent oxidoreductase [Halioglobus sp.]|nr:SDR family NAD(P)-dependent oxidoreductase [Halioglobus sp.]